MDAGFDILELSTTQNFATIDSMKKINKLLSKLKREPMYLLFPPLGQYTEWKLAVYCDASYANLPDGVSSASGFIILLVGNQNSCPLAWNYGKIQRVVRSTLAAEALAMGESLDCALYIRRMIKDILKLDIPIERFTDNKSLCENLHSTKSVNDKRLRVDMASIKSLLENGDVKSVKWVCSRLQLADILTKRGVNSSTLRYLMESGRYMDWQTN